MPSDRHDHYVEEFLDMRLLSIGYLWEASAELR